MVEAGLRLSRSLYHFFFASFLSICRELLNVLILFGELFSFLQKDAMKGVKRFTLGCMDILLIQKGPLKSMGHEMAKTCAIGKSDISS